MYCKFNDCLYIVNYYISFNYGILHGRIGKINNSGIDNVIVKTYGFKYIVNSVKILKTIIVNKSIAQPLPFYFSKIVYFFLDKVGIIGYTVFISC